MKHSHERVVFTFGEKRNHVKHEPPTAITNNLVMTCVVCGKPRRQWDNAKRIRDNSKYCSDECRKLRAKHRVPILKSTRQAVLKRDRGKCRYCGAQAEHVDHVIPYSRGGSNALSNLVAACTACNCSVNDRAFKSFSDKRAWILRQRGLIADDREIKTVNLPASRANWQAWVYGGMKSLKAKRRPR